MVKCSFIFLLDKLVETDRLLVFLRIETSISIFSGHFILVLLDDLGLDLLLLRLFVLVDGQLVILNLFLLIDFFDPSGFLFEQLFLELDLRQHEYLFLDFKSGLAFRIHPTTI